MKRIVSILIVVLALVSATASAQYFTKNKAEHDSLAKVFEEKIGALMERDPELAETIIIGIQVSANNIITKGHGTEFVSMRRKFKKQVMQDVDSKISMLTNTAQATEMKVNATVREANTIAANLAEVDSTVGDILYFVRGLDETVANLEVVVTEEDETPARKLGLEEIRRSRAARKAAAAASMTPFR